MAGAVGRGAGALRRRAFAHVLGHSAERALVDLALRRSAEGQAGMLELDHRRRGFAAQIFDRVLVAEPVRPFDRIVHMPGPVVRAHVAERSGNPALRGDGMASGWEDLGHAGGFQPGVGSAHRRPEPGASGTDNDDVITVVDDLVCAQAAPPEPLAKAMLASANSASATPPMARKSSTRLQA